MLRDALVAELAVALARVGERAELAADKFTQVAFEVEAEIPDRVGDSGPRLPKDVTGSGFDLLVEAGEIAREEFG